MSTADIQPGDEPVKIKVGIEVKNSHEYVTDGPPRSEWDAMSADERQAYLDGLAQQEIADEVNAYAYVEGEDS
jgi:hypothetical protein